jgi:hypothetical protein
MCQKFVRDPWKRFRSGEVPDSQQEKKVYHSLTRRETAREREKQRN